MNKTDELIKQLTDMTKETKAGRLHWDIVGQTTEYNAPENKPVVEEDGCTWMVDECYVSYHCEYKGKEFLMVTYEMLHTAGDKVKSTNLVFLPPLGIRYFDIHTLLPYSVEVSQMLTYQVHTLWEMLLDMYKAKSDHVSIDMSERVLTIED